MAIQPIGNTVTMPILNQPTRAVQHGAEPATPPVETSAVAPQAQPPEAPSNLDQVKQAMAQVAKMVQEKASNLQFSIDSDTGTTVVKVVDSQTQEVIRQIPSQEMLNIAKAIQDAQGLLLRQKA